MSPRARLWAVACGGDPENGCSIRNGWSGKNATVRIAALALYPEEDNRVFAALSEKLQVLWHYPIP
jgi:hypothetical protein